MKKIMCFVLSAFFFISCSQVSQRFEIENFAEGRDLKPPVLSSVNAESETLVRLCFNENVIPYESSFAPQEVSSEGCDVVIRLNGSLKAGKSCVVSGRVCDLNGNSCEVSVKVWGRNPNPASLEINEFTTKGSGSNPDRTELKVTGFGSIAGFAFYDGIPGNYRTMVVFEDVQVKKGDFIVIWWTSAPDGKPSTEFSNGVLNIYAGSQGLSENNGILTLASSPSEGASVIDCISYSTGESNQFEGWGTKEVYERIETAKNRKWLVSEPVSPKNSSATRSVSKNPYTGQWFVTASGGSTFGKENTVISY